jgi:hypothetical protein
VAGPAAGQQVKQRPQRRGADPTAGRGQPRGTRAGNAQPVQPGDQPAPHLLIAAPFEQRGGQQQIDHDPRRQVPDPPLDAACLGQRGVDHLERHDPGQLAHMPRRERTGSDGDLVNDATGVRLDGQRSSRVEDVLADAPSYRSSVARTGIDTPTPPRP